MPPRAHGVLHKEKHVGAPLVTKRRESRWALVKELLPKLAKQTKNGTLNPVKPPISPKKCVQLPPVTK